MPHSINKWFTVNSVSVMCFAVAGGAFLAAIIGMIFTHWLSGWMATSGMVGLGLFYLALGLLERQSDAEPVLVKRQAQLHGLESPHDHEREQPQFTSAARRMVRAESEEGLVEIGK